MNDFHCKRCGCLVYHPDRGDYDYKPEAGLCRSCFLEDTTGRLAVEAGLDPELAIHNLYCAPHEEME